MRLNKKLVKAMDGSRVNDNKYEVNLADTTLAFWSMFALLVACYLLFSVLTFFHQSDKELQGYKENCKALAGDNKWFIARKPNNSGGFNNPMVCNVLIPDAQDKNKLNPVKHSL